MEKIIKIGDKEVAVKSTAASLFRYKSNFGSDGMKDLITLSKGLSGSKTNDITTMAENENFSLDVFFRFLWVFAKSADDSIPLMEKWLDGFDMLPFDFVAEVLPQMQDLLGSTIKTTVKSKN